MLPAIGDFLKNTFGESLKRPLQPAGLFAAAIFLLLNSLFVFPVLLDQGHPLAVALRDLGLGLQAVVAGVATLMLAYLLLSISSTILKLMSGESWGDSPWIGRGFRDLEAGRMRALKRQVWKMAGPSSEDRSRRRELLFHLFTNYPGSEERIGPTGLANALHATASALWDRYQIEMSVLWPHMESVVASQTAIAERVDNEKATLDFLLNLSFVLEVFAFEHVAVRVALRQWPEAVWSVGFLVLAWGFYQAAVGKARSWGAAVQLAFDLHRDDLRKALGIRPFRSVQDERDAWRRASRWLMWNESPGDLLALGSDATPRQPATGLTATASANVTVVPAIQERVVEKTEVAAPRSTRTEYMEYVLLVSDTAGTNHSSPAPVIVVASDTRVPRIAAKPLPPDGWSCELVSNAVDGPDHLIWRTNALPNGGARMLRYRLRAAAYEVDSDTPGVTIQPLPDPRPLSGVFDVDRQLQLHSSVGPDAKVVVTTFDHPSSSNAVAPGWVRVSAAGAATRVYRCEGTPVRQHDRHGYRFELNALANADDVELRYFRPGDRVRERGPRVATLLQQLLVLQGIPLHDDDTEKDHQALVHAARGAWTSDPNTWAWSALELETWAAAEDSRWSPVLRLNNLACAWMFLAEWDRADRYLHAALSSEISDTDYTGEVPAGDRDIVGAHRRTPRTVKEAADHNLALLRLVRAAWSRHGADA